MALPDGFQKGWSTDEEVVETPAIKMDTSPEDPSAKVSNLPEGFTKGWTATKPDEPEADEGTRFSDYTKSLTAGLYDLGATAGRAIDVVGNIDPTGILDQAGQNTEKFFASIAKADRDSMSPAMKQAKELKYTTDVEESWTEDPIKNFKSIFQGEAWKSPQKIAGSLLESGPVTVVGMGTGMGITGAIINQSAKMVAKGLIKKGISNTTAGIIGGFVGEGGTAAVTSGKDVYDLVVSAPAEVISKTPEYQKALEGLKARDGVQLSDKEMDLQARELVADHVAMVSMGKVFVATGVLGSLSGAYMGHLLGGSAKGGVVRKIGTEAGLEGLQETPQSGYEVLEQNLQKKKFVDPNLDPWEGVKEGSVSGFVQGVVMGGGMATGPAILSRGGPKEEKRIDDSAKDNLKKNGLLESDDSSAGVDIIGSFGFVNQPIDTVIETLASATPEILAGQLTDDILANEHFQNIIGELGESGVDIENPAALRKAIVERVVPTMITSLQVGRAMAEMTTVESQQLLTDLNTIEDPKARAKAVEKLEKGIVNPKQAKAFASAALEKIAIGEKINLDQSFINFASQDGSTLNTMREDGINSANNEYEAILQKRIDNLKAHKAPTDKVKQSIVRTEAEIKSFGVSKRLNQFNTLKARDEGTLEVAEGVEIEELNEQEQLDYAELQQEFTEEKLTELGVNKYNQVKNTKEQRKAFTGTEVAAAEVGYSPELPTPKPAEKSNSTPATPATVATPATAAKEQGIDVEDLTKDDPKPKENITPRQRQAQTRLAELTEKAKSYNLTPMERVERDDLNDELKTGVQYSVPKEEKPNKTRYEGFGSGLHNYTIMEGPAKGATFAALSQDPEEVAARQKVTEAKYSITEKGGTATDQGTKTRAASKSQTSENQSLKNKQGVLDQGSTDKALNSTVDKESVQKAFPGQTVNEGAEGSFIVHTTGGVVVTVRPNADIEVDAATASAAYQKTIKPGTKAAGSFQVINGQAVIQLSKEAGTAPLKHEIFHAAEEMVLTEAEIAAVEKQHGNSEQRAEAYNNWDGTEKIPAFQKIKEFFQQLAKALGLKVDTSAAEARKVFEKMYSGKVWNREGVHERNQIKIGDIIIGVLESDTQYQLDAQKWTEAPQNLDVFGTVNNRLSKELEIIERMLGPIDTAQQYPGKQDEKGNRPLTRTIKARDLGEALFAARDDGRLGRLVDKKVNPNAIADERGLKGAERKAFLAEVKELRAGPLMTEVNSKGAPVLSQNGKAGMSVDLILGTCQPTGPCQECYAAASMIRMSAVRKALRNTVYMLVDPVSFGKRIAAEAKKVHRSKLPFIRLLGSGDLTSDEGVLAFNTLAENADRPIQIFSRHHDNLAKLKGTKEAPFLKLGSLDSDLVEYYGLDFLKENMPKRGINNAFLNRTESDKAIVDELVAADGVGLILSVGEAMHENLGPQAQDRSCPCDAEERSYMGSCRQCALNNGGCFTAFADKAVDNDGKIWNIGDKGIPKKVMPVLSFLTGKTPKESTTQAEAFAEVASDIVKKSIELVNLYRNQFLTLKEKINEHDNQFRAKIKEFKKEEAGRKKKFNTREATRKANVLKKGKEDYVEKLFKPKEKPVKTAPPTVEAASLKVGISIKDLRWPGDIVTLVDKDLYLKREKEKGRDTTEADLVSTDSRIYTDRKTVLSTVEFEISRLRGIMEKITLEKTFYLPGGEIQKPVAYRDGVKLAAPELISKEDAKADNYGFKDTKIQYSIPEGQIQAANKTARAAGAVGANAITPKYVSKTSKKDERILDFGSGDKASHTVNLKKEGFTNVTAYDFGANVIDGVHDAGALSKKFDTVFASNVINVQGSAEMLDSTMAQIAGTVDTDGRAVFNFPLQPRYGAWAFNNDTRATADPDTKTKSREADLKTIEAAIAKHFGSFKRVGGTRTAPIYEARNPNDISEAPAYHGTPHRGITKFDNGKFLSGEGAMAYGAGHYFASMRDVAEWYREKLSGGYKVSVNGKDATYLTDWDTKTPDHIDLAVRSMRSVGSIEKAAQQIDRFKKLSEKVGDEEGISTAISAKIWLDDNKQNIEITGQGQLYKVEIPEDTEMLWWDKPLSEQSEEVRDVVAKLMNEGMIPASATNLKGESVYTLVGKYLAGSQDLLNKDKDLAASIHLRSMGIKGIKYLDGTSRSKGEGAYNFVIFDGNDIEITDTYYSPKKGKGQGQKQETTLGDILTKAQTESTNKTTQRLAKLLGQFIPESKLGVKVVIDPSAKSASYTSNRASGKKLITIVMPAAHSEALHEIVHAVTVSEMESNPALRQQVKHLMSRVKAELIKQGIVSKEVLDAATEAKTSQTFKSNFNGNVDATVSDVVYAFLNEKEFLAQAFSSTQFQKILDGIKISDKGALRSSLDAFIDMIMRGLGINAKDRSAFAEAIKLVAQLAQQETTAEADTMSLSNMFSPKWFSRLQGTVQEKGSTMTGEQWLKTIASWEKKGTLPTPLQEEMEWSGLKEYLGTVFGKVSPADINTYLNNNGVQVTEKTKSGTKSEGKEVDQELLDEYIELNPNGWEIESAGMDGDMYAILDEYGNNLEGDEGYAEEYSKKSDAEVDLKHLLKLEFENLDREELLGILGRTTEDATGGGTKFQKFTVSGGENYKELLLTLPGDKYAGLNAVQISLKMFGKKLSDLNEKEQQLVTKATHAAKGEQYVGAHWDEPNVLAHVRFDERVDKDGNKVLFLQEVQSDWHQEGRKDGYLSAVDKENLAALRKKRTETIDAMDAAVDEDNDQKYWDLKAEVEDLTTQITNLSKKEGSSPTDAPFKTSWPMLAMKRVIRYATENGFDRVAWTTGEQQAGLYDLSKQVDSIYYENNGESGYTLVVEKDGNYLHEESGLDAKGLEKIIGKELAEKVINGGDQGSLDGENLKIGGEGMKAFYDKMLPSQVGRFIKKFGGKMETVNIDIGSKDWVNGTVVMEDLGIPEKEQEQYWRKLSQKDRDQHIADYRDRKANNKQPGFTITPAMQEAEGMPLFSPVTHDDISESPDSGEQSIEKMMSNIRDVATTKAGKEKGSATREQAILEQYRKLESLAKDSHSSIATKQAMIASFLKVLPTDVRAKVITPLTFISRFMAVGSHQKRLDEALAVAEKSLVEHLSREIIADIKKGSTAKKLAKNRIKKSTIGPDAHRDLGFIREVLKVDDIGLHIAGLEHQITGKEAELTTAENTKIIEQELEDLQSSLNIAETFGDLKSQNLDSLVSAREELESIITDGRASWRAEQLAFKTSMAPVIEKVQQDVSGEADPIIETAFEKTKRIAKEKTLSGRMKKNLTAIENCIVSWEFLMNKLSTLSGSKVLKSFTTTATLDAIHKASNDQIAFNMEFDKTAHKKAMEIFRAEDGKDLNEIFTAQAQDQSGKVFSYDDKGKKLKDATMSQQVAAYMYAVRKSPDSIPTFEAMHMTDQTFAEIDKFIGPELKAWVDYNVDEFLQDFHFDVNQVYRKVFGANLTKSKSYITWHREVAGEITDKGIAGAPTSQGAKGMSRGAFKERVKNTSHFKMMGFNDVLVKHVSDMNNFRAWAMTTKIINSIFNNKTTQKLIEQHHGSNMLKNIKHFQEDFTKSPSQLRGDLPWLDRLRGDITTAMTGLNPTIYIKQLTSVPAMMESIPASQWAKYFALSWANLPKAYRTLDQSVAWQGRRESGMERDIRTAQLATGSQSIAGIKTLKQRAMFLVKWGDGAAVMIGGYPVYMYHYEQNVKQMGHEAANKFALEKFEKAMNSTQQASGVQDMGNLQRSGSYAKMFTMFITSPKQYTSHILAAVRGIKRNPKDVDSYKRLFIFAVMMPSMFSAASSGLLGLIGGGDEDKDKLWKDQLKAVLTSPLNGIPIIRDLQTAAIASAMGDYYGKDVDYSPMGEAASSFLSALAHGSQLIYNWAVDGEMEADTKSGHWTGLLNESFETLGYSTGLPTNTVRKMIFENWADVMNGETDYPVRRALGYSRYAMGEKGSRFSRNKTSVKEAIKRQKNNEQRPDDGGLLKLKYALKDIESRERNFKKMRDFAKTDERREHFDAKIEELRKKFNSRF